MNASTFQLQTEYVHQELAMRHFGLIGFVEHHFQVFRNEREPK